MAKERRSWALAVNGAALLLGCAGGFALALWLTTGGRLPLEGLVTGYALALNSGGGRPGLGQVLWDVFRWPLMAWVLGFTALGLWLLPLLFAARGFLFAYSVAGLAGALGPGGLLLAAVIFGLAALVELPIFIILGTRSWDGAGRIRGRLFPKMGERRLYSPQERRKVAVCAWILAGCGLVQYWLFPPLLRVVIPLIRG